MGGNIIAFSGTHGTGKSTCAYSLAATLKLKGFNVAVIDELARECPLKINKDANLSTQYWIISSQIKREIEIADKYDFIITDRAVMDTVSYGVSLGLFDMNFGHFLKSHILKMYGSIFVLNPHGFSYQVADGVRDMCTFFRQDVHNNLIMLYKTIGIDYQIVDYPDNLKECVDSYFGRAIL